MKMVSFDPARPKVLEDVWRVERERRSATQRAPVWVFILQDWDVYFESINLNEQIELIKEAAADPVGFKKDQTLKNLFKHINKAEFEDGTVAIMNAVAGLREEGSKRTGYLTDPIHIGAYHGWVEILKKFSTGDRAALKHVFFCGEWAKWDDTVWGNTIPLQNYIAKWDRWTKSVKKWAPYFGSITSSVIPHPAIWHLNMKKILAPKISEVRQA